MAEVEQDDAVQDDAVEELDATVDDTDDSSMSRHRQQPTPTVASTSCQMVWMWPCLSKRMAGKGM